MLVEVERRVRKYGINAFVSQKRQHIEAVSLEKGT